jgi:hypothetical protein
VLVDDLQWVDSASLAVIRSLMARTANTHRIGTSKRRAMSERMTAREAESTHCRSSTSTATPCVVATDSSALRSACVSQ